jgi:hypothetical protein
VRQEGLAAADPLDSGGAEDVVGERLEQPGGAGDRAARLVPLEHHELEVVTGTALAAAKGPGELVDRTRPQRQEPLHEQLGTRLQVAVVAAEPHPDRLDVRLGHDLGAEHRCIDLDEAPGVEAVRERPSHPRTELEESSDRHPAARRWITSSRACGADRRPPGK